ncbi:MULTISPECIES: outer membrane protein transport protein [Acinetobacter]|uniref:Transport of long-chain fatty acid n=1 Tax=Acinetobacter piscicola TaxID=2006115 RepID=A0A7S6VUX3_9GAMM|nr:MULTISPECIES: outer membrane protein transport protein [Acinetobacter]QOW45385.1 transport of long-chain fatty acid [Acinetobacter piscicola]
MNTGFLGTLAFGMSPCLCFAAGLENSEQSISAFLEKDNYLELSIAQIHPHVSGQVTNHDLLEKVGVSDFSTGQLIQDYSMFNAAIKIQYHPHWSLGFIYDQPYKAELDDQYAPSSLLPNKTIEAAKFKVKSQSLTHLWGYQPDLNWKVYAGFTLQELQSKLSLEGLSYSIMSGYQAEFKADTAVGWLAGVHYQIPEYALSTSISYHSKIKHNHHVNETLAGQKIQFVPNSSTNIQTPQSVNVDFKTAVSNKHLIYGSLRWVNWQDFNMQPTQFNAILDAAVMQYPELIQKFNLIEYKKDQWSSQLGLAHRVNDQWIMLTDVSWDSGTGNPAGTLNPSDGFYALGLGAMYQLQPNRFITAGLKYFKLQKAQTVQNDIFIAGNQSANLNAIDDNYAIAYGIKIGYSF